MEQPIHNLMLLFGQLGLDNTEKDIESFLNTNAPVPSEVALHDAKFWNKAQVSFLKEAIEDDADWAEVVDELNALLRRPH